jgi:signal transduction histidine kinase
MKETSSRPPESNLQGHILSVVLILISYVITFGSKLTDPTPFRIGLLIGLGVVFTAIGLACDDYCEREGSPAVLVAYFAVQIAIGTAIMYLSENRAWLLMLPLAGKSVTWLSGRWPVVISATVLVTMVAPIGLEMLTVIDADGEQMFPLNSGNFWFALLQNLLSFGGAIAFVMIFTQVAVRERDARAEVERLAAELRDANRQLREYAVQAGELATLRERTRLAREIHDGLGHYLTAINMQIQAGRAVLAHNHETALNAFDQAQTLAQEGLAEVRRSVAALRASPLDTRPLTEAVGDLVDECRAAGIATDYVVLGEARALDLQVEQVLYRVAQEGMTNVRKHAQASQAQVALEYPEAGGERAVVRLTVRDYGVGSDDPSGGYGLIGIRERVRLLQGEMHIETAPGEGFALTVEVPGSFVSGSSG